MFLLGWFSDILPGLFTNVLVGWFSDNSLLGLFANVLVGLFGTVLVGWSYYVLLGLYFDELVFLGLRQNEANEFKILSLGFFAIVFAGWYFYVLLGLYFDVLAFLRLRQNEANEANEVKILLLGLENARRTTLLRMLQDEHQPTQYPTSEEFRIGGIKFKAYDFGGPRISCRVWQDYHLRVAAVVYLVNLHDDEARIEEWKTELSTLLSNRAVAEVPVIVLADTTNGVLEDPLLLSLQRPFQVLDDRYPNMFFFSFDRTKSLRVFACDIDRRMAYRDGFEWLSQCIING